MNIDRLVLLSRNFSCSIALHFLACFWFWGAAQAAPGDKKWELLIGAASSPALAPDGNIIVAVGAGKLLAINPSGETRWTNQMSAGSPGICVTPGGLIYVGSDKLYAFNADGSKRWEFDANELFFHTPVGAADGTIYSVSSGGSLYALKPDGSVLWKVPAPRSPGELVLARDGALIGGFSATNPDGMNRWTFPGGQTMYSAPALDAEGTIYVGSLNGSFAATLFVLHFDGQVKWTFTAEGTILGAPVIGSDGTSYFRTDAGIVYAVDRDGQKRWEYNTGAAEPGTTPSSVALAANGTIYVGSLDGRVHALNAAGEHKWDFPTGARLVMAPLIGPDGTIYVGTDAGSFFAIEGEGSGLANAPWPMHRRDTRFSASYAEAPTLPPPPQSTAASTNQFTDKIRVTWQSAIGAVSYEIWRGDAAEPGGATLLGPIFGKLEFEDRSAVPGQVYFYFVKSINSAGASGLGGPAAGARRIANPGELVWKFAINGAVGTPALAPDGTAYATGSDGKLHAIQADGVKKWEFDYAGSAATAPTVGADGTIYFAASTRLNALTQPREGWSFFAVTPEGGKKWRHDRRGTVPPSMALGDDGTLCATTVEGVGVAYWLALNADGTTRWELAHEDDIISNLAVGADGALYAGTRDGQVLSVSKEGRFRWRMSSGGGYLGAIAIDATGVLFVSGNELFVVNPDGVRRGLFPGTDAGVSPAAVGPSGRIYLGSNDGKLSVLNQTGAKISEFVVGGMPGAVAVGADGAVYFSSLSNPFAPVFTFYAYNPGGTRKWDFSLGTNIGPPVMGGENLVYFAANDGALYALRTEAPLGDTSWPAFQSDGQRTGRARKTPPLPATPQGVLASATLSPAYVQIRWASVLGATGYDILRSTGVDPGAADLIASDVSGRLTYNDTTGTPESLYNYWVRARSPAGPGNHSSMVSATRRRPAPGDLLYEWTLQGIIHGSPAIGPDGTVYVGVQAQTATVGASSLYALNPDGTTKWARAWTAWIFGAAAIGPDGTIYYGGYHRSFLALNPDGSVKWGMDPGGIVINSPAIGEEGEVYFGTVAGKFYCVESNGTVRWTFTAAAGIFSAPSIGGDGAVYFRGGNSLYALNRDGTERWRSKSVFANQTPLCSSPAIAPDGTIYVGSDVGALLAFNSDGVERWRLTSPAGFLASPVLDAAGNIVIGSAGLYSVKPDGATNWVFPAGPVWATAALVENGLAYVATYEGKFFAVNPDGSKAWETAFGTPIVSSPAVAPDGTIYVGGQDGKVRAIHGGSALAQTPWPKYQRDLRHTARADRRVSAPVQPAGLLASDDEFNNKVQVKWNSAPNAWNYELWRGRTPSLPDAALLAGRITATNTIDDFSAEPEVTYHYWLRAGNDLGFTAFVGPESGRRRLPLLGEKVGEMAAVFDASSAPAQSTDGTIYVAGRGRLHALNPDLTKKWQYPTNSLAGFDSFSPPAIGADGSVYFGAPNGRFYALTATGTKLWEYNLRGELAGGPAIGSDGSIYICSNLDRRLISFRPDGSTNWTYPLPNGGVGGPAVDVDGTIYLAGADRFLYAVRGDGGLKWRFNISATPNTSLALGPDGAIFFGTTGRRLRAVSGQGIGLWSFSLGGELTAPPVIGPDSTIYVGASDSKVYAITYGGQKKWEFPAGGAIRGSPTIGQDGSIFFGSADRKVYALNALGAKIWESNPRAPLNGSPIDGFQMLTAEKTLLAGTQDGTLHGIHAGMNLADAFWPVFGQDARHSGRRPDYLGLAEIGPVRRFAGEAAEFQPRLSINRTFAKVELFEGTMRVAVAETAPFTLVWTNISLGAHVLTLRATDTNNCQYVSAPFVVEAVEAVETITVQVTVDGFNRPVLAFNARSGGRYQVQYTSDFQEWNVDPTLLESADGTIRWVDDGPPRTASHPGETPLRFYRVSRAGGQPLPGQ